MRTREQIEQLEKETLAPYAAKSRESAGRNFSEPPHPLRTCYQRDRDRIIHCEAFRKLEYRTQVFNIFEGDYYRTRLTHTLEVAQMARTIGRNLRLNEDLIEAIALAHDLGHPPFGHAGEQALNKIMEKQGGFNHNKRSLEIVTKYEKRYPDFDGLNLSREVLVGILKHETLYDIAGISEKYPEGPSLEARVVDCADSLAYLSHDVDDGLESKCITIEDLKENGLWQWAIRNLADTIRDDNLEMLRYQIVRQLIDMQVRDLLATTDQKLSALHLSSAAEAREKAREVVNFSPQMKQERDGLQQLLIDKLYSHHRVMRMSSRAKRIIRELFVAYVREPNLLPPSVYPAGEFSPERKYEIICNYIASMTDRSASDEHKELH